MASDTPDESCASFSAVVEITPTTTKPFYTLEVPIARHFLANGIVSHNCNPPNKKHWTHLLFMDHLEPMSKVALKRPELYAALLMNPLDNEENLPPGYIEDFLGGLSKRKRERFLLGLWLDTVEGALWKDTDIGRLREPPAGDRIVVAIDPAASSGENADETGIVVAMKAGDRFIVLDDLSGHYTPDQWTRKAIGAYHAWRADRIIGERNNGGDMVEDCIQTREPGISTATVWASRGKSVRAEPIAALYEQGRGFHVGLFPELEDQMCAWVQGATVKEMGFSPDRMDALVWAATELMLGEEHATGVTAIEWGEGG